MATITEIRSAGTDLSLVSTPIYEPLNEPTTLLGSILSRFNDGSYNVSTSSNLYHFLLGLCGESGAGQLQKQMLYPRLQSSLSTTSFSDLDKFYGVPLRLPRIAAEIYSVDPKNEALTESDWNDVRTKDAMYRARCFIWMRALIAGPTPEGIALAAEAATGIQCDVFEQYVYLENAGSDQVAPLAAFGQTNSPNEFVIIPQTDVLTQAEYRRINHLIDQIKPVNTICTIYNTAATRTPQNIRIADSSSTGFYVSRHVTGRTDITWPTPDATQGLWITTEENEAPTFAYMNTQETVTYLTVIGATASSEHLGMFNKMQRNLFGNLNYNFDPLYVFAASNVYNTASAPLQIQIPWTTTNDITLVNTYYPLTYLLSNNTTQPPVTTDFWASGEECPGTSETLTINFGRTRPINYIDFEITYKPIDITIEYQNNLGNWVEVDYDPLFQRQTTIHYLPAKTNPWGYFEYHFASVQTQFIRITFARRNDPFPLDVSDKFQWSIDVRNARFMNVIQSIDDYVDDSGTDILGNFFHTSLTTYPASNIIDPNNTNPWQSQPNPTPFAVESLYFDVRTNAIPGTMAELDLGITADFDTRSQADMESYYADSIVIDEVYIDPITFGPTMHIYYSMDDTPEWDDKLWIPINRDYVLKRGFAALPSPVNTKYMKLEFTNLTPTPYNTYEYPQLPATKYRLYPTWVQDYFNAGNNVTNFIDPIDRVTIDPLALGFQKEIDRFDDGLSTRNHPAIDTDQVINSYLTGSSPPEQTTTEDQIEFNSPYMYQLDLISQLNNRRALSRVAAQGETGWNAEQVPPPIDPPSIQSVPDLTQAHEAKIMPVMYFPYKCRHGYQVLEGSKTGKVSYSVAIRNVGFYRRDYNAEYDEQFYIETFEDTAHFGSVNDFTQDDWRWIITP